MTLNRTIAEALNKGFVNISCIAKKVRKELPGGIENILQWSFRENKEIFREITKVFDISLLNENTKKIAVFGGGDNCRELLSRMHKAGKLELVSAVYDSDIKRCFGEIYGIKILPPSYEEINANDIVIISSRDYLEEIYEQLLKMGVDKNKLFQLDRTYYIDCFGKGYGG